MTNAFALDLKLAADTAAICDWQLSRVLLMNDARFPWIILVPRREGAMELFDLTESDRVLLTNEITRASAILKSWSQGHAGCDKVNIGIIGNIVPQLHIHIVARMKTDAAWPYPVWGRGEALRYPAGKLEQNVAELLALF